MTKFFFLAGMIVAASAAAAQETDIQGVIGDQITAFRADDFPAAFGHASPTIRRLFGTPERFGEMVRQGYPMVHRPEEFRFLGVEERGARTLQRVMIRDGQGRTHFLEYEMIDGENGWKINGVRILPPQGAGA